MAKEATVSDILSDNFSTIKGKDNLSKALGKFKTVRPKPHLLVVTDNKGRYKGIITERDIVRRTFDPKSKVGNIVSKVMRRAPVIGTDLSVPEATKLMLGNEIKYLPVIEKGRVLGIVRDVDILNRVVRTKFGKEQVERFVTKEPFVLKPADSVGKALNMFREKNISRAPVIKGKKVLGILTMHNIAVNLVQPKTKEGRGELAGESKALLKIPVKGIMTKSLITCSMSEKVKAIVKKMNKNDITGIVVLDNKSNLAGIVTKKDLLESVASLTKPKTQKFFIQAAGELGQLNENDKQVYSDELQSFVDQYDSKFNEGHLYVYIQLDREKTRKKRQFSCKANFTTDNGRFHSTEKGWGPQQALRKCLNSIDKQIKKKFGKRIHRVPRKGLYPSRIK